MVALRFELSCIVLGSLFFSACASPAISPNITSSESVCISQLDQVVLASIIGSGTPSSIPARSAVIHLILPESDVEFFKLNKMAIWASASSPRRGINCRSPKYGLARRWNLVRFLYCPAFSGFTRAPVGLCPSAWS